MGMWDFLGDIAGDVFDFGNNERNNDNNRDAAAALNSQNIEFQRATNQQNMDFQREVNASNIAQQDRVNAQNLSIYEDGMRRQEEAARNSIQWRVEDAIKAGIHPMYAIGAPGISVSPSVANLGSSMSQASSSVAPHADYLAQGSTLPVGQSINRAITAMQTKGERANAAMHELASNQLDLAERGARIRVLESEAALNDRSQIGAPAPSSEPVNDMGPMGGGVRSRRVQPVPASPTINSVYDNSREAGNVTDRTYARTPRGHLAPIMSMDANQRIQEDPGGMIMWNYRNRIQPFFSKNNVVPSTKEFPLPAGQRWGFDRWQGEYRPYYTKNRKWVK